MKIGYALGGGGGKGGFQAGALWALHENGVTPSVVSGISVGALNGILVATGQYGLMRETWQTITDDQVRQEPGVLQYGLRFALHKIGVRKPQIGYWKSGPLQALVRKSILGQTLRCDYYAGVVQPGQNIFKHLHIERGLTFTEENVDRYVSYIVGSTAIPAIFEPVYIDGELSVDGGVHHQMPLRPLTRKEVDYIVGISMMGGRYRGQAIRDDLDMLQWLIPALLDQTATEDFERFELLNELARMHGGQFHWKGKLRKYYPNTIIRPLRGLSPSTRFHHRFAIPDFIHGQRMAQRITQESFS